MSEKFTVDYFIAKFEAIPEEKLVAIPARFMNSNGVGCALGHCGFSPERDFQTEESEALRKLFQNHGLSVTFVNDGSKDFQPYRQPTPRQRILAALRDIKSQPQNPTPSERR